MIIKLIKRLYRAFNYSIAGLIAAIENEVAFRLEIFAAAILIPFSFFIAHNALQFSLMIGVIILVFIVELLNSAIEAIVDRISLEQHPLSKRAKDMGSAAAFLSQLMVLLIWGGVIWDNW